MQNPATNDSRRTHIVDPFNPRFEFGQSELDLDRKDDSPIRFAIPALLRFGTPRQRGEVRAYDA